MSKHTTKQDSKSHEDLRTAAKARLEVEQGHPIPFPPEPVFTPTLDEPFEVAAPVVVPELQGKPLGKLPLARHAAPLVEPALPLVGRVRVRAR